MVVYCCVTGCKTVGTSGFHKFPADPEKANKWIRLTKTFHYAENVDQPTKVEDDAHRVCRKHFKETDQLLDSNGQKCLAINAIPCLFLPGSLTPKLEHNYQVRDEMSSKNRNPRKRRCQEPSVNNASLDVANEVEIGYSNEFEEVQAKRCKLIETNLFRSVNWEEKFRQCFKENAELKEKLRLSSKEKAKLKVQLRNNRHAIADLKKQISYGKLNDSNILEYLHRKKNFNPQQVEFLTMQVKNSGKDSHGYRFSPEQKSLSLALYKQSPKSYRYMQGIFLLPNKRTLGRHSAKLVFQSGIDHKLFDFIKQRVKGMPKIDTYCSVAWDEVALKAHLHYNGTKDVIEGFVELANERKPTFATHSPTFMIRGINAQYKQPITYYYTSGLKAFELAELVILTTEAVFDTGLVVIGSTCDQVSTNVSSVHLLINPNCISRTSDGKLLSYKIVGNTIIHCYDLPHLIKVVRNNFHKKDIVHFVSNRWDVSNSTVIEKKPKLASWSHVSDLYDYDLQRLHRLLPKITDEHINPNMLKMKVSVATQVFSASYGRAMLHCSQRKILPKNFSDTAHILIFFNDLFDSLNGSGDSQDGMLKGSINENSVHFVFWNYAVEMLSKMKFVDKETGEVNNYSTVFQKFQSTIRGFIAITKLCLNLNMNEVSLRNANQDGLENFFGCVKSGCHIAKCQPVATQFRTGYATMIINNVTGARSISSNCEQDSSLPLLNNLHDLLLDYKENNTERSNNDKNENSNIETDETDLLDTIIFDPQFSKPELCSSEDQALSYSSNVICKKILQITECRKCQQNLQSNSQSDIVAVKEQPYDVGLTYPSRSFMRSFNSVFCGINEIIPHICSENSIKKSIISQIEKIKIEEIGCSKHAEYISMKLKDFSTHYALQSFCKNINQILCGKIKVVPTNSNAIQDLALAFRKKKKHIGKYSPISEE